MYTDAHRSFLQLLTAKRLLTAPQVNANYEAACAKHEVDPRSTGGLQTFVMAINMAISPLHLSIKKSVQEDLRADKSCFVLINTHNTEHTKGLNLMLPWEENLFENIIESIVTSEDGSIPEVQAINLGPALPGHKISVSDSEAAIGRMITSKLLNKDGDTLLLSGLTLSEQQQQLEATYPQHCVKCAMCKIITLQGHACDECQVRVHRGCGLKLWRQAKREPYCPACDAKWLFVKVPSQK